MAAKTPKVSTCKYFTVTYYDGDSTRKLTRRVFASTTLSLDLGESGALFELIDDAELSVFSVPYRSLISCIADEESKIPMCATIPLLSK